MSNFFWTKAKNNLLTIGIKEKLYKINGSSKTQGNFFICWQYILLTGLLNNYSLPKGFIEGVLDLGLEVMN